MKLNLNFIKKAYMHRYGVYDREYNDLVRSLNKTEPDDEPIQAEYLMNTSWIGFQDTVILTFRYVKGFEREKIHYGIFCIEQRWRMPAHEWINTDVQFNKKVLDIVRRYVKGQGVSKEFYEWVRSDFFGIVGASLGDRVCDRAMIDAQKEEFLRMQQCIEKGIKYTHPDLKGY